MPWPPFPWERVPVTIVQNAGWTSGLVWVGLDKRKYLVSTWVLNESGLHKFLQEMTDGYNSTLVLQVSTCLHVRYSFGSANECQ